MSHNVNNNSKMEVPFSSILTNPQTNIDRELESLNASVMEVVKRFFEKSSLGANSQVRSKIEDGLAVFIQTVQNSVPMTKWDQSLIDTEIGSANLVAPGLPPARSGVNYVSRIPRVGSYSEEEFKMGASSLSIRLHPGQIANFPDEVAQAIGGQMENKVDLYLNVQNIASIIDHLRDKHLPQQLNLITHPWSQPHYMPQQKKDITVDVQMGIYHPMHIYAISSNDGISLNGLKKLPVTLHPVGENHATAFSPNTAHLGIDSNQPFASFWSVVKEGKRTVATKHVLLTHSEGISQNIQEKLQESYSILNMIENLENEKVSSLKKLKEVSEQFLNNPQANPDLINALEVDQRNLIYFETYLTKWTEKNQNPPHMDFGKASFIRSQDLDPKWHCSHVEMGQIVNKYAQKLEASWDRLIGEMKTLFAPTQELPLSKEDELKIKVLKPIADAFEKGDEDTGFKLFNSLNKEFQDRIYTNVWEMFNCPDCFDFGSKSFHKSEQISKRQRCRNEERASAIRYFMYSI